MKYKFFSFEFKKIPDEEGAFDGYASVFDIIDQGNDRIFKGAFKKTLREQKEFPLHWYHNLREPVGEVTAKEDSNGLWVEGILDLNVQRAKELRSLAQKTKRVARMLSIGYDAIKVDFEKLKDKTIRNLREIKLYEVSLVTYGMNQRAFLNEMKAQLGTEETAEDLLAAVLNIEKAELISMDRSMILKAWERLDEILAQQKPPEPGISAKVQPFDLFDSLKELKPGNPALKGQLFEGLADLSKNT